MKRILAFLMGLMPALVGAGNGPHTCVWGAACTFPVDIYAPDGVDFALTADVAIPLGDIEVYCPGEAVANPSSSAAEIAPRGFVILLPSNLTDCARFEVKIRDQDATPTYLAMSAHVETCGNPSAAHVNCTSALSTHAATDIVTGGAIGTTAGAVDSVTLVATTTTNTDMRGTDGASTHAPTDIVTGGAIGTTAGAVDNVTTVATTTTNTDMRGTDNAAPASTALSTVEWTNARAANLDDLDATVSSRAPLSTALSNATWTNARASYLDNINGHTAQTGDNYAILNTLTEDVAGLRYTQKALEQAPTGAVASDVNVIQWNSVPLATTNPLPNAAPGGEGGLPTVSSGAVTQPVTVSAYDAALDFNATQKASVNTEMLQVVQSQRLHELVASPLIAQPTAQSIFGDLTQDNGSGVQQFTANALALGPTASLTEQELALALGGFVATINTVTNPTTFEITPGPASADSINDEYTASIRDATNSNIPSCHRQVIDYVPPGTLVIDSNCPAGFTVAAGDSIVVLPNGAGAPIASVNVNNGQVETDLTVNVDGALSLGCMLSAINAVQTGAQTVVGGTDYTYRNPGDTQDRVVASRTASGRTQATITCPAGL